MCDVMFCDEAAAGNDELIKQRADDKPMLTVRKGGQLMGKDSKCGDMCCIYYINIRIL
jgi:hypothetical protein